MADFSETVSAKIPAIGLGTGGAVHLTSSEAEEAVSTALEIGYRHIDTAILYGNHAGVGRGIRESSVPREEIILGTKVPPEKLDYSTLIDCLVESTAELGVDRIDIGYVHFPTGNYDPDETFSALGELLDRGTIGNVGVSNFTADDLLTALDHTDDEIAVNQIEHHPLWRQPELIEFCRNQGIYNIAYAPLARGRVFSLAPIQEIAEKHQVSPAAVTLAWITNKPNVSTIVKSTDPEHMAENLQAPSVSLDERDVRKIEAIDERTRLVDPTEYGRSDGDG